jgi:hypothetical protein
MGDHIKRKERLTGRGFIQMRGTHSDSNTDTYATVVQLESWQNYFVPSPR